MMEEIKLELNENGQGHFLIFENNEQLGEMEISIADDKLTVYHTEVAPKAEGKGFAKKMLEKMVAHARMHSLKVVPLCPYVHLQFRRHPDEYTDVWSRSE